MPLFHVLEGPLIYLLPNSKKNALGDNPLCFLSSLPHKGSLPT